MSLTNDLTSKIIDGFSQEVMKQSINLITNTYIKPFLEKYKEKSKLRRNVEDNIYFNKFRDYMARAYENYRYMQTIVFNNQQIEIEKLYIPLELISQEKDEKQIITDYHENLINKYKKIIITDSGGMGKSTLMKWLFLSCIKKNAGIPVFIELRNVNEKTSLLDELYDKLNPVNDEFDKNFINELINKGDFIFFLDGYDEIPFKEAEKTTKNIQKFISKAQKNIFIMSSRPQNSLTSFNNFQSFKIKPLEKSEAYYLLRQYDVSRKYSSALIEKLEENNTWQTISDFLTNPLMISLLYKGFEYKPMIPLKKHIFYRNVYDALFEHHDLSKGDSYIRPKKTNLDSEEFHRVVRKLGFLCLKENEIEFDKDKIINLIEVAKDSLSETKFNSSDFLSDLHIAVPIFAEFGNSYKWSHKSFMEYFAAKYIEVDAKEQQTNILKAIYNSKRSYDNLLDLYYDIDYPTFEKIFIYELAKDFMIHMNNSYTSFNNKIAPNEITQRKELTFNHKIYLFKFSAKATLKQLTIFGKKNQVDAIMFKNNHAIGIKYLKRNINSIIEILFYKNSNLVKIYVVKERYYNKIRSLLSSETMLTDDPELIHNSKDNFSNINKLLSDQGIICIDTNRIMELYDKLKREHSKNNSNDLVMGL